VACPDPPPSHPYLLSLHDALPILPSVGRAMMHRDLDRGVHLLRLTEIMMDAFGERGALQRHDALIALRVLALIHREGEVPLSQRSEEHTSELQSRENLVCRLLLEK